MLDLAALNAAKFIPRTEIIPMDGLAKSMGVEDASILVRGLTADEINRAQSASKTNKLAQELADSLIRQKDAESSDKMRALLGYGGDVQQITAIELEIVSAAIIEPEGMTLQNVVAISEGFPIEFKSLVEAVNRLTGLGKQLAGSKESGEASKDKIV